jgi:hypothetical protein
MQHYFKIPTSESISRQIYNDIIHVHETGGKFYSFKIPHGLPISFINDVIDKLANLLLEADIIELVNGHIVIDWA